MREGGRGGRVKERRRGLCSMITVSPAILSEPALRCFTPSVPRARRTLSLSLRRCLRGNTVAINATTVNGTSRALHKWRVTTTIASTRFKRQRKRERARVSK